jgi:hypothetical protein
MGQKPYRSEHPQGAKSSNSQDKLDKKRGMGKKSHR